MKFNIDLAIVSTYLILTLIIGVWKGRNVKSLKEYAIADRSYSTVIIVASIFATFIGGGATVGVTGAKVGLRAAVASALKSEIGASYFFSIFMPFSIIFG